MAKDDLVIVKFRLYDGSDLGPFKYPTTTTIDMLKQRVISEWPQGKTITPKVATEVKLIAFGKILDNKMTIGQYNVPFGEVGDEVTIITMHVVVQPSHTKSKARKMIADLHKKAVCGCTVM